MSEPSLIAKEIGLILARKARDEELNDPGGTPIDQRGHEIHCDVEWKNGQAIWRRAIPMGDTASICPDCQRRISKLLPGGL
jgi:hypothetical protein